MSDELNNDIQIDRDRVKKDFQHYRQILAFLGGNVPIQALCLPKVIENALVADGCLRVYDLINRDLGKIKGLGRSRIDLLTSRLDEFFAISL